MWPAPLLSTGGWVFREWVYSIFTSLCIAKKTILMNWKSKNCWCINIKMYSENLLDAFVPLWSPLIYYVSWCECLAIVSFPCMPCRWMQVVSGTAEVWQQGSVCPSHTPQQDCWFMYMSIFKFLCCRYYMVIFPTGAAVGDTLCISICTLSFYYMPPPLFSLPPVLPYTLLYCMTHIM